MPDQDAKFVISNITRAEIAEELNAWLTRNNQHTTSYFTPDDVRLTDEICQQFADTNNEQLQEHLDHVTEERFSGNGPTTSEIIMGIIAKQPKPKTLNPEATFAAIVFTRREIADTISAYREDPDEVGTSSYKPGTRDHVSIDDTRLTDEFCTWWCQEFRNRLFAEVAKGTLSLFKMEDRLVGDADAKLGLK